MYTWKEILNADRSVTPAWMGWKLDVEFSSCLYWLWPHTFLLALFKSSLWISCAVYFICRPSNKLGQKKRLKSRHCYCTVYNQGQMECSGKYIRAAVPLWCSRKLCISSKFSSFLVESSKTQPLEMQQLCLFLNEVILRAFYLEYLPKYLHSSPALPAPRLCGKLLGLPAEAGGKPYATECTAAAFLISRSVIGEFGLITSRSCRRHLWKEKQEGEEWVINVHCSAKQAVWRQAHVADHTSDFPAKQMSAVALTAVAAF